MFIPDEYRVRFENARAKVEEVIKSVNVDEITKELAKVIGSHLGEIMSIKVVKESGVGDESLKDLVYGIEGGWIVDIGGWKGVRIIDC